jgi:hypothetical protein
MNTLGSLIRCLCFNFRGDRQQFFQELTIK